MLAYGYCRYSSDLQTEASIEQQKAEIEEYSAKNGITILDYYVDEAKSGKKSTRENFQQMISDACKYKKVQAILVWKTDRFARNTVDNLMFRRQLSKYGVRLISITQPISDETPEGKLMNTLLAGMDEYYIENLASNVKRALKSNAKESLFNGGIPPLGYDVIDKKYVINEHEAEAVRKIFDMKLKGYSLIDISLELNKLGYKTKRGTEFKKNSIYDLLKNEKYIGNYIYGKGTKENHREIREDMVRHVGTIPAIISEEVFYKVNKRKEAKTSTASKNFYLLTGLIKCGKCGSTYTGTTQVTKKNGKTFKNAYYRCSGNTKIGKCDSKMIKKELIEEKVTKLILEQLLNEDTMENIINNVCSEYKKGQKDFKEDIKLMQKNIDDMEKEANKLLDMCCKGFGNKKISDRMKEIEEKQEFLRGEIEERQKFVEHNFLTPEKVRNALKKDIVNFNVKTQKELKNLIQKWIIKIEVTNSEAIVYMDFGSCEPQKLVAKM